MIGLALTAALFFAQQGPRVAVPKALSAVEGKVVNSANGEPVRKAIVILRSKDAAKGASYAEETDGNGHFLIDAVAPGEYQISADRQGFFLLAPGARGGPAPSLKVESGQHLEDVIVRLTPLGVISGRVLDQDGDPVRGAMVRAMRYVYQAGKRQLQGVESVTANDQGDFRLFGLRAGTFYLQVFSRSGPQEPEEGFRGPRPQVANANTYYPGTTDVKRAAPIQLEAGVQLHGFDIQLRPELSYAVRFKLPKAENVAYLARVVGADGPGPEMGVGYKLVAGELLEFPNLAPGAYMVTVMQRTDDKKSFARQAINVVNADVDGGTLAFSAPVDVSGVLRVAGTPPKPFESLRVSLQPVDPSAWGGASADVKPDGTFKFADVAPAPYQFAFGQNMPSLYVKSVRLGDQELSDRHIDLAPGATGQLVVVLGSDVGEVDGSVHKADGQPAVGARVNVIAYGTGLGRIDLSRLAFTNDQGDFHVANVAPGEYKVFAWEDVPVGAPQDPEYRKPFEKQAASIRMPPNGRQKVDLTAIPATATPSVDQ
jgi:hypothetical protein